MVEMKIGNAPAELAATAPEQGGQNMQDCLSQMAERDRDRRNRGENDSIDQVISVVKEMLPQLPPLGVRASIGAAPVAEKMPRVGLLQAQASGVQGRDCGNTSGAANLPAGDAPAAMSSAPGIASGGLMSGATGRVAENVGMTQIGFAAQSSRPLMLDAESAVGNVTDVATLSLLDASRRADTNRREAGAVANDEMPGQAKPLLAQDTQQHHAQTNTGTEVSLQHRADRALAAAGSEHAASGATQDGWVYSFRSWEGQHAVRVLQTPGMHSAAQSSFAALALHPNSALVEQRLNAHGNMTHTSDQWVLREYSEEGRQRQQDQESRQGRQQHQDEEES